jgi:hypothetical protein
MQPKSYRFPRLHRAVAASAGTTVLFVLLTHGPGPLLAQGLPPQASLVAQDVLEGELEVQIEDSERGSRTLHFIQTTRGRFRLELPDDGPDWQTGSLVRARGRFRDAGTLELGAGGSLEPMALANSNTFGEQRTIVILVNFQDNQSVPYGPSHAANVTFGTTSSFYLENSHAQTWLTGDVAGWFTLPMGSTSCDTNAIASYADQAAAAAGYNLSQYARKVYAFPKIGACSWWGLGSVGGSPSRAWVNGTFSLKVVAHELGHNFGDYHSRSRACTSTGCSTSEYGDDADVMGNPTSGHMNAFQKERLGWLNYGDAPAILAVGQNGPYWIDSYAVNDPASAAPKALKILESVDGSGLRTWYYVEARTQTGFDGGVAPGVILHTGYEGSGREIYEVDLDPVTSTSDWRLTAGQTFEDTTLGLRITTLWSDSTGAMIDVAFESQPCATAAPTMSASPSGTVTLQPGAPASYSLTVGNRDAAACSASTFDLDAWVPAGWTASFSPASLDIASGGSASASLIVTPSSTATGSSDIQIGAYRSGASGVSVVRTIAIDPVSEPPAADLAVSLTVGNTRQGYPITARVTDASAPVSGAQVTFTITDAGGSSRTFNATTNGSGQATTTYKPRNKDPKGTYTVVATATAGGATAMATATFVVN